MTKERRKYSLPPCEGYEVDGTERWLEAQAQQGWQLEKDGFFAGFARFVRGEPKTVRYRLTAAQKSTSMWADDMGEPDEDEVALSEKYGWEYVAKRGEFYIYRTENPGARELNTDPEVQALALEAVRKRRGSSGLTLAIWVLLFWALNHWGGSLLLLMLSMRSWYFLLTVLLIGSSLADAIRTERAFRRMQRELREAGEIRPRPLRPKRYYGRLFGGIFLSVLWVALGLHLWSDDIMDIGRLPLSAFDGTVPFATMGELAGGEITSYEESMKGLQFNSVEERRDLLASRIIHWRQHADLKNAEGVRLDGGLYITYYEMRSRWLAERLARDLLREARHQEHFEAFAPPELEADFAAAYYDFVHFPNLLLQRGKVVLEVQFFQSGPEQKLTNEQWMTRMADSLLPS